MTTLTETLYSRSIRIDAHYYELQPGDQVDNSLDFTPVWNTIARVGKHDDDKDNEDAPDDMYCEGDCHLVLFFEDDDCAYPLHVQDSDEIYARFPVGGDQ